MIFKLLVIILLFMIVVELAEIGRILKGEQSNNRTRKPHDRIV